MARLVCGSIWHDGYEQWISKFALSMMYVWPVCPNCGSRLLIAERR